MAEIDWNSELVEQLHWHWDSFVRPRLGPLTDDQYFWEPAPGCWSVRRRGEERTNDAQGSGDFVLDWERPEPVPPPLTTIAWRLAHIALVLGERASNHFGDGSVTYGSFAYAGTAKQAIAQVDEQYELWTAGVRALGHEGLHRPCGPAEGPYARAPFAALVLHVNRETLHHSAEVLTLLDLYRSTRAQGTARPVIG